MCLKISVAVSSPVYFLIKVPRQKFFSHFAIILSNCRICEDYVSVNCLHRRPLRRFVLRDSSFKDLVVLKSPDHYNIVSTILLKSCPLNSWPSFSRSCNYTPAQNHREIRHRVLCPGGKTV